MARLVAVSSIGSKQQVMAALFIVAVIAAFLFIFFISIRHTHGAASLAKPYPTSIKLNSDNPTSNASPLSEESSASPEGSSDSGQAGASSTTKVTVNGQDISLPPNGSIDQTLIDSEGNTTIVHAEHSENSTSSAGGGQSTSTNSNTVNIDTTSGGVE